MHELYCIPTFKIFDGKPGYFLCHGLFVSFKKAFSTDLHVTDSIQSPESKTCAINRNFFKNEILEFRIQNSVNNDVVRFTVT